MLPRVSSNNGEALLHHYVAAKRFGRGERLGSSNDRPGAVRVGAGAAAGDASAYGRIGYLYKRGGPGLDRDWEQACHYYRRAGPKWRREAREVCPTLPYLFIDTLRSPIFWGLVVMGTAIGLLTALAHRRRPRTDPDRPGPVI